MKRQAKTVISILLTAVLSFMLLVPAGAADLGKAERKAEALKRLGLFKGVSDTDFALNRAPSRAEALVMLIRVLGKESEALSGTYSHPFTDVASWVDQYVGYAYENGLTKGVSATEFGTGDASSDMYLTFVLRALGYDDSANDFSWDAPNALAQSVGILPDDVDTENFLRADVALVSWAALEAELKDGSRTLSEKLAAAGVFTAEEYSAAAASADDGTESSSRTDAYETENGAAQVKSMGALKAAMADAAVTEIDLAGSFEISEDITITKPLWIIEMSVSNSAAITVKAEVTLGGAIFENTGSITVGEGGFLGVYQSELKNRGVCAVELGGTVELDRGGQFENFGTLQNAGTVTVTADGGNLSNAETGVIENNGAIDCTGYYNNFGTYMGTGTEPRGIGAQ